MPLQVLVVYLGDMRWKWLPLHSLLPFQKHRQEKVAEAEALIVAKRLTKPILFNKAIRVTRFFPYYVFLLFSVLTRLNCKSLDMPKVKRGSTMCIL